MSIDLAAYRDRAGLLSRRALLRRTALGFGSLGLSALLGSESAGAKGTPISSKPPHFKARATKIIFLFMSGGPSHIDTFDPKPRLDNEHGKPIPFKLGFTFANDEYIGGLMKSPWDFNQYGESGIPISDLFPQVATCADDLCVVRSVVGEGVDHGGALLQLNTGAINFTRPSLGSWVFYGLGTENENLPGFVVIKASDAKLYGSAFLPGQYQSTSIGDGKSKLDELIKNPVQHVVNPELSAEQQRYELDMLRQANRAHQADRQYDSQLEARIQAFELASRMQLEAPEAFDVERESSATKQLYGYDEGPTRGFAWQCMLARRLVERGVRYVQCSHSPLPTWDQHTQLQRIHLRNAKEVDQPIAGLLTDLKARGLLDETLVMWGGEFGRTPFMERDGRDHNPWGFTIWMAGGGVKPGTIYGATDEYGYHAVEDRMHIHDLHATILHLLGLDHTRLTYPFGGRDFRLTDVHGNVAYKIVS